jgi:uncharacterized protein YjbI with pentapeptide repeats
MQKDGMIVGSMKIAIMSDRRMRAVNRQKFGFGYQGSAWLVGSFLIINLIINLGLMMTVASPVWALNYSQQNLVEADFSGKDLRGSIFDHANLRSTNFSHANLQGVRFFSSNLESANFEGADLRGADLESARLTQTNFNNANLTGAFAINTLFNGATINGADFTDVLLSKKSLLVLCAIAEGINPETGQDTRETLFCP